MFSILPDLTPRDSHSLWYVSTRNPNLAAFSALEPGSSIGDNNGPTTATAMATTVTPNPTQNTPAPNPAGPQARGGNAPSTAAQIIERSPLGRLHAEELLMERRRAAVTNLGSTWLKPPGVSKTLFQMREERREAEEHAEAMRREMLAQELAEAEAAAQAAAEAMGADGDGEEGVDDDMMMMGGDEVRDLDEDIPDADEGGFGYDGASDEDEEEEEEEEEDEGEVEDEVDDAGEVEGEHEMSQEELQHQRRARRRELAHTMASIRATEERMRQMMARGTPQDGNVEGSIYSAEDDIDEEQQGQMLDEDNLLSGDAHHEEEVEPGSHMDMDANLDDDIPEAEHGSYEHTDSEASLSSNGDGHDLSYARSSHSLHHRGSLRRSEAPRSSLDISGFLSRDGSSIVGSSPHIRRGNQ
ncbi:dbfc3437-0a49-42e7-9543-dbc4fe64a4c6 [Thermothielavioides terrestris]|uniref:Uncharacterized protein n=2 Tax=Thermothielavioides terrestris TaxID=2587410 RepID=G2RFR6_THETT|nr:uncharacterized protein THITE_2124363 [Thermothielavioides terrestris NRRL 8126]AEO71670.1 hypothetical protein THITE_2124363 [Thermothielavioides terrestris NRRL 8126]SPQ27342.1 dbfc3437-0a49-42e7-9543-dbc4fe64a4c6 [Thermothielavioides terrestris]